MVMRVRNGSAPEKLAMSAKHLASIDFMFIVQTTRCCNDYLAADWGF